jgi:hypothetical protein
LTKYSVIKFFRFENLIGLEQTHIYLRKTEKNNPETIFDKIYVILPSSVQFLAPAVDPAIHPQPPTQDSPYFSQIKSSRTITTSNADLPTQTS